MTLGPDDHELPVEHQRRHTRDTEFLRRGLVGAHLGAEGVGAPQLFGPDDADLAREGVQNSSVAHEFDPR